MGQQQLLLVILVTIIVGIATVVAINVFGTSAASANEDAVRQDILTIASASQGWYIKPEMMGGGGNSFTGIDFTKFNFSAEKISATDPKIAENMNGTYTITVAGDGASFTVTADPASCEGYTPSADGADPTDGSCATEDQLEASVYAQDLVWATN